MSANNWTLCPKCYNKKREAVTEVRELYGRIPVEDYEKQMAAAKSKKLTESEQSLREDWSIGIRGDIYQVDYYASCQCGFAFTHRYEKKIE